MTNSININTENAGNAEVGDKNQGQGDSAQGSTEADKVNVDAGTGDKVTAKEGGDDPDKADEPKKDSGSGDKSDDDFIAATFDKVKLPDDFTVDDDSVKSLNGIFESDGISQETAQKLVDLKIAGDRKFIEDNQKQIAADLDAEETAWLDELKIDADFGGDDFDANMKLSLEGIKVYGGDDTVALLSKYGLDKNPLIVKLGYELGKQHNPSAFGAGSSGKAGAGLDEKYAIFNKK